MVSVWCAGESLDEMRLLEEQARRIAEESKKDKPKTMTFVKFVSLLHILLLFGIIISIMHHFALISL